jgi:hypothetical protein
MLSLKTEEEWKKKYFEDLKMANRIRLEAEERSKKAEKIFLEELRIDGLIKDLGDLGIYTIENRYYILETPGRKYDPKKEFNKQPREYEMWHLNPKDVRLGDILVTYGFRRAGDYIVSLDEDQRLIIKRFGDRSGYGKVPLSVSSHFTNAIQTYVSMEIYDLHSIELSYRDEGLRKLFNNIDLPEDYDYLYYPDHYPVHGISVGLDFEPITVNEADEMSKKFVGSPMAKEQLAEALRNRET